MLEAQDALRQAIQNAPNRRRAGARPRVLERIANAAGFPLPPDQNEQEQEQNGQAERAGGPANVNVAPPPVIPILPNLPVNEFQGFWAPGGQWHPWPAAPAEDLADQAPTEGAQPLPEDVPPAPALNPTPSDASDSSTSSSTTAASALFADVSDSTGESSTTAQSAVQGSGPTGASSSSATASSSETKLSVREAVRAAALARFSRSSSENIPTTATTSDPSNQSVPTRTTNSTEPAPGPDTSSVEASSSQSIGAGPSKLNATPSSASTQPAANQPANTTFLPPLIPLYDPSSIQTQTRSFRGLSNRPAGTQQNVRSTYAPGQQQRTGSSQRSLRTLPATLTDQQLATMDRLTREAIDERLRILDDVQSVTSRCIDELLRCRSVLPRATPRTEAETSPSRTQQQQQAAPSSTSSTSIPSSSDAGPSTAVQTSTSTGEVELQEEDRPIENI